MTVGGGVGERDFLVLEVDFLGNMKEFEKKILPEAQRIAKDMEKELRIVPKMDLKDAEGGVSNLNETIKSRLRLSDTTFDGFFAKNLKKFRDFNEKANENLKSVGLTTRDISILLGAGLAGGTAFILRAALEFIGGAVQANFDLKEQINVTKETFGEAADEVLRFGRGAASSLAISNTAALEAASGFGLLFQNLNRSEAEAAKGGTALVQLAADIASFRNLDPNDVVQRLQSGLVGNLDALRRLGVFLNEDTVKAKALERGYVGLNEQLSQQDKIAATLRLTIEQTAKAHEDYLRTAESGANIQRRLNAQYQDSKAKIGGFFGTVGKAFVVGTEELIRNISSIPSDISQDLLNILTFGGEMDAQTKKQAESQKAFTDEVKRTKQAYKDLLELADRLGTGPEFVLPAELEERQKKVVELKRATERADREVAEAEFAEVLSGQRLADQQEETRHVLEGYIETSKEAVKATLDMKKAEISLEQAKLGSERAALGLERATRDHTEALSQQQAELRKVERGYTETYLAARQLAKAQREVESSLLGIEEAIDAVEGAEKDLQHAQRVATIVTRAYGAGSRASIAALEDVSDAELRLRRSRLSQKDSEDAVVDAQMGVVDAEEAAKVAAEQYAGTSKALVAAQDAVRDSGLEVRSAHLGVKSAALEVRDATIDAEEKTRIWRGTLKGFPADSEEARKALLALREAELADLRTVDSHIDATDRRKVAYEKYAEAVERVNNALVINKDLTPLAVEAEIGGLLPNLQGIALDFLGWNDQNPLPVNVKRMDRSVQESFAQHIADNPASVVGFQHGGFTDWPAGQKRLAWVHGQETIRNQEQERALANFGGGGPTTIHVQVVMPNGAILAETVLPYIRKLDQRLRPRQTSAPLN